MCAIDDWLPFLRINRPSSTCVSQVRVRCMRRHERVSLRGYWCEDAFLVKANTVGTPTIGRGVEAVTTDLEQSASRLSCTGPLERAYLASPAIPTGDGGALSRCWLVEAHMC